MQQQPDPFILNLPPNTILQQIRITTQNSQITIQPIISPQFKPGDIIKVREGQIGIFDSCTSEHITLKVCITPKENIRLDKTYSAFEARYTTKEEIKYFFKVLAKHNMSFDFKTLKLIDNRFHPYKGQTYYSVQVLENNRIIPVELEWWGDSTDYLLHRKNLVFKTLEEASKFIKNLCINTKSK